MQRGGKQVTLGNFANAEEAALCVARSLEGQAAAKRAAVQPHVASGDGDDDDACEEVEVDAVEVDAWADDDEEAALVVAQSPEGQAAARRPAVAAPLTSEEALQQAQAEGLVLRVANSKTGYWCVHKKGPYYGFRVQSSY